MTPSSCSTAPSLISFQAKRSFTPVMAARLRMRLVANASSLFRHPDRSLAQRGGVEGPVLWMHRQKQVPRLRRPFGAAPLGMTAKKNLHRRAQSLLLGEGAVNLVAQGLGLAAEEVARAREVDRDDGLDAAGPRGEDDDAVGERHRLVDVVGD